MQPYFFPYIGYFQLIHAVDLFILYDNVQFSKKGWVQRNRILNNGKDFLFSLPLKKDSDFLDVVDRRLSENFDQESNKILRKISESYKKTPFFNHVFSMVERCMEFQNRGLFDFVFFSIMEINNYLDINTPIKISSSISNERTLKGEKRVLEICKKVNADTYINLPGGKNLYKKEIFEKEGISLSFLKPSLKPYIQFGDKFIPGLSIIDVLMFNEKEKVKELLHGFEVE